MRFVLFLFVFIMFIITYKYNHTDWFDNPIIDTIVQIFHIGIIGFILYFSITHSYILITILGICILLKNIQWFLFGSNNDEDEDYENDENDDNSNNIDDDKNDKEL